MIGVINLMIDEDHFVQLTNTIEESISKYTENIALKILIILNKEEMANYIIYEYLERCSKQQLKNEIAEDIFLYLCKERRIG